MLEEIVASKREEVDRLRSREGKLERSASEAPPARDFLGAIRTPGRVAVIAEFKRRSPSSGSFAASADPADAARAYEEGGAAALSVLTDGPYFDGSLADLRDAREACALPILRKDFLLDPVQVLESRANGADAVLLIVRILDGDRLEELLAAARETELAALVEVHDAAELKRAAEAGAEAIGVNARDLESFAVDLAVSEELVGRVPGDRAAVAESGIRGRPDVLRMGVSGADAVLVGGWLMSRDPGAVSELVGVERRGVREGEPAGASGAAATGDAAPEADEGEEG